jgi:hypothetical protein
MSKAKMNKLPASEFDEIYEACKDGGLWNGAKFSYHVYQYSVKLYNQIGGDSSLGIGSDEYAAQNARFLEAYRSGEIRDRGEYRASFRVRLLGSYGDYKTGEIINVVDPDDFPNDYICIDDMQPAGQRFLYPKDACEIVDTPQQKYRTIKAVFFNNGVGVHQLYKTLAETTFDEVKVTLLDPVAVSYDHAFSVKDGRMVVDWDALEVTKENALEISIASWKWAYEWMQENCEIVSRYDSECALCQIHRWREDIDKMCNGCPIYYKTGRAGCKDTPYVKYSKTYNKHEALDACRDEIAFLEGLR